MDDFFSSCTEKYMGYRCEELNIDVIFPCKLFLELTIFRTACVFHLCNVSIFYQLSEDVQRTTLFPDGHRSIVSV